MKKAMGLKGFMNSVSKPKMQMGDKYTSKDSSDYVRLSKEKKKYVDDAWNYSGSIKGPEKRKFPDSPARAKYNETSKKILANPYFQQKVAPLNKPSMKKGGSFPDLNKDGQITKADILMGRGVIDKPKGQKGMNVMKEAKKNATPSIPNSYYKMGGMKEENPLASMIKKKPMKKSGMKPKMAMGGSFFSMSPNTPMIATEGKDFMNKQSFKKGGMSKKKKK